MSYPTHPDWDPNTMLETSWVYITVGPTLERAVNALSNTGAQAAGEGPFFDRALSEMRSMARRVGLASTAITSVGRKLASDAETEILHLQLNAKAENRDSA